MNKRPNGRTNGRTDGLRNLLVLETAALVRNGSESEKVPLALQPCDLICSNAEWDRAGVHRVHNSQSAQTASPYSH